jgi:LPS-assembly lipoprotein
MLIASCIHLKRVTLLFFLTLLLVLNACGFHPRNQHVLPPSLRCLKIDSNTPYGDFESTLRRSLMKIGVEVKRCGQAPISVHIISTLTYQDVPTIGGSNQARVYVYYYQVTFELLDASHHVLLPPQTVKTSETLIINAGTALESTTQLDVLKLEMQKEAAHMIINILNTVK